MYGRYPGSYQKGGDDTHVHVHAAPPTKDQQIGMSGLIIALIAILAIIVVSIMVYKNQNSVATTANTTAATTSNVAVPMSSTTSTGFVDTVVVGTATVSAYYIMTGNSATTYNFPTPTYTTPSTITGYVGAVDFTSGYWQLTINNLIDVDQTSPYLDYAAGSNISDYQMFVCMDPGMTTIPGTSFPYSYATDGAFLINGASTTSSSGVVSIDYSNLPLAGYYQYSGTNSSTSLNQFVGGTGLMNMPPLIIYINVPSDITYYIFNWPMFATTNTAVATYTDCPFVCNYTWNATRLSNPIPETTMPYSSYFAPVTATPTGSGGAAAATPTVPTGASSYKKGKFYGGGNVYDQYC
jgi:hypothetical protein